MTRPAALMATLGGVALFWAATAASAELNPAIPEPGVYKHRFDNGDVSGDSFKSEDVLEIVPYRPAVDYFRLHLEFYNGHMCDLWGMADATPTGLLYKGPADFQGAPCRLTIVRRRDGVHLYEGENGACRNQSCGERGGYGYKADGDPDFKPGERADIRYMPRLLASSEYKAAVAAYAGTPKPPAKPPAP